MNLITTIIISISFCLLSTTTIASPASNTGKIKGFEAGLKFFENNQYLQAIEVFESLKNTEENSDVLNYNLAVAYYKSENLIKAKDYFSTLKTSRKYASIAYLNLGLISTKQNKLKLAQFYFEKSIDFDKTGNTSPLANRMISRISKEIDTTTSINPNSWFKIASLKAGLENRIVNSKDTNETIKNSENIYGSISLYAARDVLKKQTKQLNLSFSLLSKFNESSNSDFNFDLLSSSITKTVKYSKWQLMPTFSASYMVLGGESFENLFEPSFRIKRTLFEKHNLSVQFKKSYIDGYGAEFASFDGWQEKIKFENQYNFSPIKFGGYYEHEKNDRENNKQTSKLKFDYSPTRHKWKFYFNVKLPYKFGFKLAADYRTSEYSITQRSDKMKRLDVRMTYELSKAFDLIAKYEYIKNKSDNNKYAYSRDQFSAGIKYMSW